MASFWCLGSVISVTGMMLFCWENVAAQMAQPQQLVSGEWIQ